MTVVDLNYCYVNKYIDILPVTPDKRNVMALVTSFHATHANGVTF